MYRRPREGTVTGLTILENLVTTSVTRLDGVEDWGTMLQGKGKGQRISMLEERDNDQFCPYSWATELIPAAKVTICKHLTSEFWEMISDCAIGEVLKGAKETVLSGPQRDWWWERTGRCHLRSSSYLLTMLFLANAISSMSSTLFVKWGWGLFLSSMTAMNWDHRIK